MTKQLVRTSSLAFGNTEGDGNRGHEAEEVSAAEPYLTSRTNNDGSKRYYFQPRSCDKAAGWKIIPLRDDRGYPIRAREPARQACRRLTRLYMAWQAGRAGYGPHCIDSLGRPVPKHHRLMASTMLADDGTISAIVRDYLASRSFLKRKASTQDDYRLCLKALVRDFGSRQWCSIDKKEAQAWVLANGDSLSMRHQIYRTCRAVLNKTHLFYPRTHPGFVSRDDNPFARLEIELPKARLIAWPRAAICATVAIADELGRPSLGDALLLMSWLGTRRQDWLAWPATIFDSPYLSWKSEKTGVSVTIPWTQIPELKERIEAAKVRHKSAAVQSTVFFVDDHGMRLWTPSRIHKAFHELRTELAKRHESFKTTYAVNFYPGDPMRIPAAKLTMRVLRHTCITALHDAGCVREQIRAITGHSMSSIDEILEHYTALTTDQAGSALAKLVAHQAQQHAPEAA